MKLGEFKSLLSDNADKQFSIALPNQNQVPMSFHITEVGLVSKTFIDCGGKVHSTQTCQLQVWVGEDEDHRLNAGKLARILDLSRSVVPDDELVLEFEYEDDGPTVDKFLKTRALAALLIRLLARLQRLGTVPVIDYDVYSKILSV